MSLRVWCDCDGVLADFTLRYLKFVEEFFGRSHALDECISHDLNECITSEEEDEHIWKNGFDAIPGSVFEMAEVPGAIAGITELRKFGRVGVLTSPHFGPYWVPERARWLLQRGFIKREIIFAADKAAVAGDVLIEDNLTNCEAWSAAHPNGWAILLDRPWNKGEIPLWKYGVHYRILRVPDWPSVVAQVEAISNNVVARSQ